MPDFYQGTELWDLSLVDPDNRRPVDFAAAAARCSTAWPRASRPTRPRGLDARRSAPSSSPHWPDGRVKLYLTHRALTLRRSARRLFGAGGYRALAADGARAEHLVALARRRRTRGRDRGGAAPHRAPRRPHRPLPLGEPAWGETWVVLADDLAGVYRDRFTGPTVTSERRDGLARCPPGPRFAHFPVALLERVAPGRPPDEPAAHGPTRAPDALRRLPAR